MTFKVKFNFKVKIYPILSLWICPRDKSPLIEVRISKFGTKMHLSTVKIPVDFGIDWPRSSVLFIFISNQFYLGNFASLIYLRRFVYIHWSHRHWVFHIPHGSAHILILMPADNLTMDRETVYHYILVRPSEFSQPRLGNWHWILQAVIGFRHIIYASHAEMLYANINQSPKQQ